jgi:hypothetical protein
MPVLLMALALLWAQSLGLLHGLVHTHLPQGVEAHGDHQVEDDHHTDATTFFERLFSGHASDSDCRLYDQLSGADAAPAFAAPVLPLSLTPFVFSLLPGLVVARWHALFQARGPPHLR